MSGAADRIRACAAGITFQQLRLFESVGRLSNVRRGAEECNLSQPAVTQALAKLEQQLGTQLLERRASGSYLTDHGRILHGRATRMFDQIIQALIALNVPGGRAGAEAVAHRISRSQARGLIAIAECGSLALAARDLGLTPAALQRAGRDLESNLHHPIFFRTAQGLVVTQQGIVLGSRLKLALKEIEWALQELEIARGSDESRIVIGALPFGGNMLLASALEDFLARHRGADLRIVNEHADEMMRRLRNGDVDFVLGLIQDTQASDLSHHTLATTPYHIVARRTHPLAARRHVTLDDLSRFDWIVGSRKSDRRTCFDALFLGRTMPAAPIETSSISVVRKLLSGADRLTLMTSYELQHDDAALINLPFATPLPPPAIGITQRANWLPTELHLEFIDLLRSHTWVEERIQPTSHMHGIRKYLKLL